MKVDDLNGKPSMRLSKTEKRWMIVEGFMTVNLVIASYFILTFFTFNFLASKMTLFDMPNKTYLEFFGWTRFQFALVQVFLFVIFWTVSLSIAYNYLKNRYTMLKMNHLLDYIKYISKGHYEERLPKVEYVNLNEVVDAINTLVESTVRARAEEKKIEQSKDELIANVGHDLRTPLTSIIGYLGLIENKQYYSEEELLKFAHIAYKKAKSMQGLVGDLFDFAASRLDSYQLHPSKVEIHLFLDQIAADFEVQASQLGIEIIVETQPKAIIASFDAEKMARVYNNLISNALKYGIGANYIKLNVYRVGSTIYAEVRNNGEKLPEEDLERIFERSFRSDASRNAEIPGTGLGLVIVRNIVELHKGTVHAKIDGDDLVFAMKFVEAKIS